MKLACASGSFHRDIERGELTQLEFLDLCARELACDGVVLDARHFPRSDEDYLAQIKKMATDRGLTIAALSDSAFFASSAERMAAELDRAVTLGAPLVAGCLAHETECSWTDQSARLGVATSLAKDRNVTLALRNAAQTFAATTHDCKRVSKEADSAWLRFGPEPGRFDAASDPRSLQPNSVLLWSDARFETERSIGELIEIFADFRGHLVLDESSGMATIEGLALAMRRWRTALAHATDAQEILNRK
jgi:sugar phosphate isomerase/epimerase